MNKRAYKRLLGLTLTGLTLVGAGALAVSTVTVASTSAASTSAASTSAASTSAKIAPADAQTTKAVKAAQAFIATLTATQKKAVLFAFNDSVQRVHWSNFPTGAVTRSGVRWGEMNAQQRSALMTLLGTVLSPEGVATAQQQMDADDIVKATDTGPKAAAQTPPMATGGAATQPPAGGGGSGGNGTRPSVNFGSDYYYVSFVGTPSLTSAWMLQFGGHHLAINATIVGPNITLSPSLSGGEPLKFTKNGKAIYIVGKEVKAASALLNSLNATQKTKAIVSTKSADLVLGPGHDGQTLQAEGIAGSALSASQKTLFIAVIKSRLGMLNDNDLAAKMADVQKNLDKTYFAWYGPTMPEGAAYFRVTGPTVILEFAPQANDGDVTDHAHNMYRDPTNEYGAAWTSLK